MKVLTPGTVSNEDGAMAALLERLSSPHLPGQLVQALNPRWGAGLPGGRSQGVIESIVPMGVDAAVVRVRPPRRFPVHRPGQFLGLGVDVHGVRHRRSFTITSLPGEDHLELTVQATAHGVVSRHLVSHARPGEVVQLGGPAGDFVLRDEPGPVLLLAGGSGITPFVAMLRSLAVDVVHHGAARPDVVLVHHVRSRRAALHLGELMALDATMPWLRMELVTTRGADGRPVGGAHLSPSGLEELCPDWADRTAFACGPDGLLDAARRHWAGAGRADRLHVEAFGPAIPAVPAAPGSPAGTSHRATFAPSGRAAEAEASPPLLAVAEAAGLAPRSGCRMGICHTCSVPLRSGRARDLRTGVLVPEGRNVQLCVSAAATDVVLELSPSREPRPGRRRAPTTSVSTTTPR